MTSLLRLPVDVHRYTLTLEGSKILAFTSDILDVVIDVTRDGALDIKM